MDDVIENLANTFEEDGVNRQTLDDLRKVCLQLCLACSLISSPILLLRRSLTYLDMVI